MKYITIESVIYIDGDLIEFNSVFDTRQRVLYDRHYFSVNFLSDCFVH